MATETVAIREKSRRVKNHILDRYLKLADRVDQKGIGDLSENEVKTYTNLTEDFAKNVIPRSQEITGEEGEAIQHAITGINYIVPDGNNATTDPQATPSV